MSDKKTESHPSGMSVGDIYFVLFRRKWLILAFSLAGILGAIAVCVIKPPQYKSEAELSLDLLDTKALSAPGDENRPMNGSGGSIMTTEMEILQSLDLAERVVQAMTPEKILAGAGGGADTNQAAFLIKNGLTVEATPPGSGVIHLTFQHPDTNIVQSALSYIIDGYFEKHFQMHHGVIVFGAFLTNEIARLHGELEQTQKKILQAKAEVGVINTDDAKQAYSDQITKIKSQISDAEGELAERQAALRALAKSTTLTNGEPAAKVPADQFETYRRICTRLASLNKKEDDLLTQQGFTEGSIPVTEVRSQIAEAKKIKSILEDKYPQLTGMDLPTSTPGRPEVVNDLPADFAKVAALKSRIDFLNSQKDKVWIEATNFERLEVTISGLQQKKESEETNIKYFTDNQARSQFDQALNEEKASNISVIQPPTPPARGWSKKFQKKVGGLAAGGILAGLALAFLMELVLDRTVKRPSEIEYKLRLPLFISIPNMAKNGYRAQLRGVKRLQLAEAAGGSSAGKTPPENGVAPWDRRHPLRRFYEGLRDRLIVHFEVRNLLHKPKLVAVTSCGRSAGVSSIAAGLAASLSETGDGNVLLVNISGDQGAAQQFYKGEPGYSLDEVLEADKKQGALVKANLYATTAQANGDFLPASLPKKLAALMPKLKASEYDYIIFDMPPVNQTSVTARLSGLMDMVLLVIESEKTNQDVVLRVNKLLAESKANVSTVLNKSRNYVPAKLHQEFLNDV